MTLFLDLNAVANQSFVDKTITTHTNAAIRNSKDYVYGKWVYKVLGIWKGYHRVKKSSPVSCMKPWTEARNNDKYMKYHSTLTYQHSFWNVSRKVDSHAGGKWFIHGPKRRKENQPETPLLIILSIVCKWGPWQHVQSVIRYPKCCHLGYRVYQYLY